MNRVISIFLMLIMVLSLSACGKVGSQNTNINSDNNSTATATDDFDLGKFLTVEDVKNAKETDSSLFEYSEVDGGVSITGYNGEDEIVVVPEQIDGKTVVELGSNSFVNNHIIKGIKISSKVTKIGNSAFLNCVELQIYVSGDSVKTIDMYAFSGCLKLETIELNNGLEVLGGLCFGGTNLTEIEIPSSVTEINYPFTVNDDNHYITVVAETGSVAEQYVNEKGEEYHLIFQEK